MGNQQLSKENNMYNLQTFEEKVNSITDDKLKILEFNGVKKPVKFICLKCGKEQKVQRGEVLLRKGKNYQCQFCHYTKEEKTLETKHKIENLLKNRPISLKYFRRVGENATFFCSNCNNTFRREPLRFLKNPTCPSCEGGGKNSLDFTLKQLKKIHGEDYEILNLEDYVNTRTPLKIRHKCGFIWRSSLHNLIYHSCPKCSKKTSKGERAIMAYLDSHNIKYIPQFKQTIKNHNLFFDFFLPDFNLFIEFQGEQHYIPIKAWGGEEDLIVRQYRDNLKRDWCKENHCSLLEIPYTQFINIDKILESSTTSSNT